MNAIAAEGRGMKTLLVVVGVLVVQVLLVWGYFAALERNSGSVVAKYRQDIIAICLRHDTSDWNQNKTLDCERSNRTPT